MSSPINIVADSAMPINPISNQAQQQQATATATPEVASKNSNANAQQQSNFQNKDQVKNLVQNLNQAISPLNTSIKFGVDRHDVFFVSVLDTKTDKVISRFPAEQAAQVLPKAKALVGVIFDKKG
jgi:flagellar protein FlaG